MAEDTAAIADGTEEAGAGPGAAKGTTRVSIGPDGVMSLGGAGLTRRRLLGALSGDGYGGNGRSRSPSRCRALPSASNGIGHTTRARGPISGLMVNFTRARKWTEHRILPFLL